MAEEPTVIPALVSLRTAFHFHARSVQKATKFPDNMRPNFHQSLKKKTNYRVALP